MHGLDSEWLSLSIGWGYVTSVLMWLFMLWAYGWESLDDN